MILMVPSYPLFFFAHRLNFLLYLGKQGLSNCSESAGPGVVSPAHPALGIALHAQHDVLRQLFI